MKARTALLAHVVFAVHLAVTLFLAGLIWFVQVVHYPLFAEVGPDAFVAYEAAHHVLTTWVVAPAMLVELATAIALVCAPVGVSRLKAVAGLALLALIWTSTAALQVPCHEILVNGFDEAAHQRLVQTNWLRTIAWSTRALLLLTALPIVSRSPTR